MIKSKRKKLPKWTIEELKDRKLIAEIKKGRVEYKRTGGVPAKGFLERIGGSHGKK